MIFGLAEVLHLICAVQERVILKEKLQKILGVGAARLPCPGGEV